MKHASTLCRIILVCLFGSALAFGQRPTPAGLGIKPAAVVAAARAQVGVTLSYDPEYRTLKYPNGDVPPETGVCSDVVIRALRVQQLDLQQLVHEDMAGNFSAYPREWGLRKTDKNIDHRRVLNLMTYFKRRGYEVPITKSGDDYMQGDIVAWNLSVHLPHIGIVSDRRSESGTPLVIHNIGSGAKEEDTLFTYKIIGHYRLPKAATE